MTIEAGQLRREPRTKVVWRVLVIEERIAQRGDRESANVVWLEKLTPPAAGLGYCREASQVERWAVVTGIEDAA